MAGPPYQPGVWAASIGAAYLVWWVHTTHSGWGVWDTTKHSEFPDRIIYHLLGLRLVFSPWAILGLILLTMWGEGSKEKSDLLTILTKQL